MHTLSVNKALVGGSWFVLLSLTGGYGAPGMIIMTANLINVWAMGLTMDHKTKKNIATCKYSGRLWEG